MNYLIIKNNDTMIRSKCPKCKKYFNSEPCQCLSDFENKSKNKGNCCWVRHSGNHLEEGFYIQCNYCKQVFEIKFEAV
jgi:hypothetical protein